MPEVEPQAPAPVIPVGDTRQIAEDVWLIPDHQIPLVPNIAIIEGADAVLVVDTAMGPANGERVLDELRGVTSQSRVLITVTHFHPEHGFGAQVLRREGTLLYNRAQAEELRAKGPEYLEMFRGFGPAVAEQLHGVELVDPDVVYDASATVALGGVHAELIEHGPAHTRGDQVVFIPERRILFCGDLVENRLLPIVPDADVAPDRWIKALEALERLEPEIVVPGHGEPGTTDLIAEVRRYLLLVRSRVGELLADGVAGSGLVSALEPELAERYADWGGHEWIAPGIEAFAREQRGAHR